MSISYSSACKLRHRPMTNKGGMPRPPEGKIDLRAYLIMCFWWRRSK